MRLLYYNTAPITARRSIVLAKFWNPRGERENDAYKYHKIDCQIVFNWKWEWQEWIGLLEKIVKPPYQEYVLKQYEHQKGAFDIKINEHPEAWYEYRSGSNMWLETDMNVRTNRSTWIELNHIQLKAMIALNDDIIRFFEEGLPTNCKCSYNKSPEQESHIFNRCSQDHDIET